MRNAPTKLVSTLLALTCLVCSLSALAQQPPESSRQDDLPIAAPPQPYPNRTALELAPHDAKDVRKPNMGDIVEQPQPTSMPRERIRRDAAVKLAMGGLTVSCPAGNATCTSRVGAFVALTALHRPETWFSWGGSLEGFSAIQAWNQGSDALVLIHNILSGRVLAQLHPVSGSRVDPYFGLGLGAAVISSRADQKSDDAVSSRALTPTPFYAARFGLDVDLTERLRLGAVADWSNLLALTGENCPWKTFGACSSSGWGAFPADNAVWKVGAELSFAFGREL
jgi:hypothetical protein